MNHVAEIAGEIAGSLPVTLELVGLALLATIVTGAAYGFVRARVRVPVLREILALGGLLGRSTPVVFAVIVQFAALWTRLPGASYGLDSGDALSHLFLPTLTLTIPFGAWASVIFYDFFRASRDPGVAAPSILQPVWMTLAWIGPALLGASLLVEPIYAWPGIARLLYFSLSQFDFGTVTGVLVTYVVAVVLLRLCERLVPADQRDAPPLASQSPDGSARHGIAVSAVGVAALAVVGIAAGAALAANLIAPVGPYSIDQLHWQGYPLAPGVGGHPLGTEENGRDLLARLLVGARVSLGIALAAALVAAAIGAVIARLTKRLRRHADRRSLSVAGIRPFAAVPFTYVAIAVLVYAFHSKAVMQPLPIALLIGVLSWPDIVPGLPMLGAASLSGFTALIGSSLLLEVTLSIHGFGVQPPVPSLGNLMANAQSTITVAPWAVFIPASVIVAVLFALYALADDLRERDASA